MVRFGREADGEGGGHDDVEESAAGGEEDVVEDEEDAKSMYRKPDPVCSEVTQLRGVWRDDGLELVITLLFDRSRFSEEQASEWGRLHCLRMGSISIYL